MSKLTLSVAILLLLSAAPALAQSNESLRGIAGVLVRVTVTGEEAKKDGLAESALRAILEERVRGAGLQLSEDGRAPALTLLVNAQKYEAEGVYAVSVDLDLYQLVRLERATQPPFHASTWRVTQVLLRTADELGSVRAVVERAADAFVKDYLSASRKQP